MTNLHFRRSQHVFLLCLLIGYVFTPCGFSQNREVIDANNEFGGRTIEEIREDYSIYALYYDADGNLAKEETVYTADYPIENNLSRLINYYYFGKKTKEERVYARSFAQRTLIEKSIIHFDRNTGELVKQENHFVKPFSEYNVIFTENGKKVRIEWHYPENIEGIERNVSYLDEDEQIVKTESFYTPKTTSEQGIFKRIYHISYNTNQYRRKSRQEWFYTEQYAKEHKGVARKVEIFHYRLGKPPRTETIFYDAEGNIVSPP